MSRLDDLKERLKTTSQNTWNSIQESAWFNQLQDRYQSLSASSQRIVWILGVLLTLAVILYYPFSKIMDSQSAISSFEEKRMLIRDLFRTSREASGQANVIPPPAFESLKASVESVLTGANLIPEQRVGTLETEIEGGLIPKSLVSHVLEIKLAKLNLKQIVDIGTSLAGISETVKMKDLFVSAHPKDTRYFDVTYKLYSLNVPEFAPEPPPEIEIKPKKGAPAGKPTDSKKGGDLE